MNRETQIPLFRGKKIDSDEWVEGDFVRSLLSNKNPKDTYYDCIIDTKSKTSYKIDPSTLAIHFPDMLASDSDRLLPNGEKDLRVFASLSEDGKGGDIVEYKLDNSKKAISVSRYKNREFYYTQQEVKVTGIKD